MKNKKGFTLIELLVTIALISAIGVAIGINILNMINSQKEKDLQQFKETLEKAACTYADVLGITETSGIDIISTCNLVKDGYLKNDITIPNTNYVIGKDRNLDIAISWNSSTGEKTCSYNVNQIPSDILTCPDIDG